MSSVDVSLCLIDRLINRLEFDCGPSLRNSVKNILNFCCMTAYRKILHKILPEYNFQHLLTYHFRRDIK